MIADAVPRAVGSRRPYPDLLEAAGFVAVGARDATSEFLDTTTKWLAASEPVREQLAAVDGAQLVADRLQAWSDDIVAIGNGWMTRSLYWARRP